MILTDGELTSISNQIRNNFDNEVDRYDFSKYPANEYAKFKREFSLLSENCNCIEDAMRWKWGHWNKSNYPLAHKNLVDEVARGWCDFVRSEDAARPKCTYEWWAAHFDRKTTYITTAYITHLVHHDVPMPIIDQHNFRSYNYYMASVRMEHKTKNSPSNWRDIEALRKFMDQIVNRLPGVELGELDRYLMMFGQRLKSTSKRAA